MKIISRHVGLARQCVLLCAFLFSLIVPCESAYSNEFNMKIDNKLFGKTLDGQQVTLYTMTNASGNSVEMIDYGAIVVSINVPDRTGKKINVTAGFSSIDGYLQRHPYFGSTVGRYCNRIAKGKFSIDGKTYSLAVNNGPNHLHGGVVGFDKLMWKVTETKSDASVGLVFSLVSPDGQEGYPGNLSVVSEYTWSNDNKLTIRFSATSDKPTPVNLTNHTYFNLSGAGSGNIYKHELMLACDTALTIDPDMIPTGELKPVSGGPLDFTTSRPIGNRIYDLRETNGFDHCFVVNGQPGTLRAAAKVTDPSSGRTMSVETTQPGIQLYSGNFLDGTPGNAGFKQHEAFCLETQHFPDSPNQASFPTTILKPGQTFEQRTTYAFGVSK